MVTATLEQALGGDEAAFGSLVDRHRRELHVHCYRMLGSFDDAEDAVQETFMRAWRNRNSFDGDILFRAWLYRIATNVCLDSIRRKARRPVTSLSYAEVPWLQPYPDPLLDELTPDDAAVERETIELAFIVALQALPARQRAALVARDILGLPAVETAAHLDTSVAAANSALQRARATLHERLPAQRSEWTSADLSDEERGVLDRFIDAHERCDARAAIAAASTDIRVTMPPNPVRFEGIDEVGALLVKAFETEREGDWRLLPTAVNRMPAAASYLRRPGDSAFRGFKLDVLRVRDGSIAEITTFGYSWFPRLGLPTDLDV